MLVDGIELDQQGQIVVVSIDLPEASHQQMQDAVDACLDKVRYDNARHFVFDLSQVEFIASACVGVLVGFLQEVEHIRGKICLAACQENVSFLFKVTQLDSVFELHDDVDDAVDSLEAA